MRFGFAIGDTGIREQVQCFDLRTDYILALFDDDLDFVAAAHIVRARDDDLAEFAFSVDPDSWGLMNAGIRRHRQLRLIEGDSDELPNRSLGNTGEWCRTRRSVSGYPDCVLVFGNIPERLD